MILGVTVEVRSSEAQEPICFTGNVKASLVLYSSRFKKSSLCFSVQAARVGPAKSQ